MSPKVKARTFSNIVNRFNEVDGVLYWKDGPHRGKRAGWTDPSGYQLVRLPEGLIRSHHVIWAMYNGYWPTETMDHIDGDPSNNRIENLRECTQKENSFNQGLQKRRKGKYKGVHEAPNGLFYVKIKRDQRNVPGLGSSRCAREAAMMYNHAAERLFGKYARFNQVFEDVETDDL